MPMKRRGAGVGRFVGGGYGGDGSAGRGWCDGFWSRVPVPVPVPAGHRRGLELRFCFRQFEKRPGHVVEEKGQFGADARGRGRRVLRRGRRGEPTVERLEPRAGFPADGDGVQELAEDSEGQRPFGPRATGAQHQGSTPLCRLGGPVQQFRLSAAAGTVQQYDGTLSRAAFREYSFHFFFLLGTFDQFHWPPPVRTIHLRGSTGPKLATPQGTRVSPRSLDGNCAPIAVAERDRRAEWRVP